MSEQNWCEKCKAYDFNCKCPNYTKMARGMFNHHIGDKNAKYLGYELIEEYNSKPWCVHKKFKSIVVKYARNNQLASSKFRVKRSFEKFA